MFGRVRVRDSSEVGCLLLGRTHFPSTSRSPRPHVVCLTMRWQSSPTVPDGQTHRPSDMTLGRWQMLVALPHRPEASNSGEQQVPFIMRDGA
jgi:hypothetical protein